MFVTLAELEIVVAYSIPAFLSRFFIFFIGLYAFSSARDSLCFSRLRFISFVRFFIAVVWVEPIHRTATIRLFLLWRRDYMHKRAEEMHWMRGEKGK